MKATEVNRRIERLGGIMTRQRGSHRQYEATTTSNDGTRVTARTTVAQHAGDIPIGPLRAIEKDVEPIFGPGWLRWHSGPTGSW